MSELTGRELDAEIAERCFQNTVVWLHDYGGNKHPYLRAKESADLYVRNYSTNMADAWLVAEWIRTQAGPELMLLWGDGRWECTVWVKVGDSIQARSGYADTPQEAICRLALEVTRQTEGK